MRSLLADGGSVQKYYREKPVRRRSVRIKDVARVEMGSEDYTAIANLTVTRLPGLL